MLRPVLHAYGFNESSTEVSPFGSGLINHTWKVKSLQGEYILQKINTTVFKRPEDIAQNIRLIAGYLERFHPHYFFVTPVLTNDGDEYFYQLNDGYYRLFPFVEGSFTKTVVDDPISAGEAAKQFGKFTRLLSGFDSSHLKITLPQFHDLDLRYDQFLLALDNENAARISSARHEIATVKKHITITNEYRDICINPAFRQRVTHHDTKISNVLFDKDGHGICVIDLDTVMPGYFISDVGDMIRTYVSPVSEEETDLGKIEVRDDFFKAIVEGYNTEMQNELSAEEKDHFIYAGKFMIYMQATRFLTDYLNNDIYYTPRYPDHNLQRARNQLVLLQRLIEKETVLAAIMREA